MEADPCKGYREARSSRASRLSNRGGTKQTLETKLAPYGYDTVENAEMAHGYIRDLNDRRRKHETASTDLDDATETLQTAKQPSNELQDERAAIFTDLDLHSSDTDQLATLCENVETYRNAQNKVERIEETVDKVETKLKQHPAFESEMLEQSTSELQAEKEEVKATADGHSELTEEDCTA